MTCKDCIHYEVCEDNLKYIQERFLKGLTFGKSEFTDGEFCNLFKDKSRFIELPCNMGDTVYHTTEIIKNEMPYESGVINEALNIVEGAVGKQIPRKPDIWGDGVDDDGDLIYDSWACPCCHEEYELGYDEYEYCPNCGQAIDMSEVEE